MLTWDEISTHYFDNTPSLDDIKLLKTNKEVQKNFKSYVGEMVSSIDTIQEQAQRFAKLGVNFFEFNLSI